MRRETRLFDSGFQETAAQVAYKLEELGVRESTTWINAGLGIEAAYRCLRG